MPVPDPPVVKPGVDVKRDAGWTEVGAWTATGFAFCGDWPPLRMK